MEQLYWNLIILFILLISVVLIQRYNQNPEHFFNFNNFASIPFMYKPQLTYFDDIPTGYDSATRSYYNPYFAQQVAQGLDTN